MKLCFRFVAKLSTNIQNETQFLMNTIVKINRKKFQQFFKIDFIRPLRTPSYKSHLGNFHKLSQDFRPDFQRLSGEDFVDHPEAYLRKETGKSNVEKAQTLEK